MSFDLPCTCGGGKEMTKVKAREDYIFQSTDLAIRISAIKRGAKITAAFKLRVDYSAGVRSMIPCMDGSSTE